MPTRYATASRLERLSQPECLQLLGYSSYVGRVGFVQKDGHPAILPVNYLLDDQAVVFRTAPGTALDALNNAAVAFEVDGSHPLGHCGWSVVAQGTAHLVTDPAEIERLRRGPLTSWAWHGADRWFRITVQTLSGRRIPQI